MPAPKPARAVIHPSVVPYTGPRLPWAGLLAAMCLCTNVAAQGFEWRPFAEVDDGATWSYRTGTVARQGDWLVAIVQRQDSSSASIYQASVRAEHCGRPRGDVQLKDINSGAVLAAAVFMEGTGSLPASIAATLCGVYRARGMV